jgi:HEAT repeat protein
LNDTDKQDEKLERIVKVLAEALEPEEDPQVKDVIASQLLALDEKLFLSYLASNKTHVRSLVIRFVLNNPDIVIRAGKKAFLSSYYNEDDGDISASYHAIFDKIDSTYFQEIEREYWKEIVLTDLRNRKREKLGKIAILCGLLELPEGFELYNHVNGLKNLIFLEYYDEILWMTKRLLTRSNTRNTQQSTRFIKELNTERLVQFVKSRKHEPRVVSLVYALLAVLGDFPPKREDVYAFFKEILKSSNYKDQIFLMEALAHSKDQKADIILCNVLATSEYDSVREIAVKTMVERQKIACLEVVRNSLIYDPDFAVRGRCVQVLAMKGEKNDTGLLIRAVLDPDSHVIKQALAALQEKQLDDRTATIVERLLENKEMKARKAGLLVLQRVNMKNKQFVLTKTLKSEKSSIKTEIIKTIGNIGTFNPEIASLLEQYLINDPFFETRGEAAISLGRVGSKDSIPLLLNQYLAEEDHEAKKGIMIALTELESLDVKREMLKILKQPNKYTENDILLAIEATGRMRIIEALECLLPYFSSSDYNVRWQAVVSAGEIMEDAVEKSPIQNKLIESIIKLIMDDLQPTIRTAACWALTRTSVIEMQRVVEVLVDRLRNDKDNMVREMAAELLGKYRSPLNEAIPVLIEMLKEEGDPSVRYYSAYSLGLIVRAVKGEIIAFKRQLEKPSSI